MYLGSWKRQGKWGGMVHLVEGGGEIVGQNVK